MGPSFLLLLNLKKRFRHFSHIPVVVHAAERQLICSGQEVAGWQEERESDTFVGRTRRYILLRPDFLATAPSHRRAIGGVGLLRQIQLQTHLLLVFAKFQRCCLLGGSAGR